MPGGRAELSSGERPSSPQKKSPTCLRKTRPSQEIKNDPGIATSQMTPCTDSSRVTRIYYYKYAGPQKAECSNSEAPAKKLYLSTATCGFDSAPKSAGQKSSVRGKALRRPPSKWASASADHNLVAMNYHLSELSLHYRAPSEAADLRPTALFRDEKEVTDDEPEEEEIVSPPPPPSSSVPSPRESAVPLNAAGSATTSSCPIPEPEEFVQKSTSNRLLNVISIDECHLKHRKARKRVKSSRHELQSRSALDPYDNERFLIPEDNADCPSLGVGSLASFIGARSTVLDRIERLHGFRSVPVIPERGTKAQQLFSRRNQLLREHMNVYVAWRTSERLKERVDKMRGVRSALGVLEAKKEERLKAFSAVLRSKEMEFAQLNEAPEAPSEGSEEALEEDDLKEALMGDEDGQNKLTRMWEVLQ